jgi:hypothetical protein
MPLHLRTNLSLLSVTPARPLQFALDLLSPLAGGF